MKEKKNRQKFEHNLPRPTQKGTMVIYKLNITYYGNVAAC